MAEGTGYIVAAYAVTWLALGALALRIAATARRARQRLASARRDAGIAS